MAASNGTFRIGSGAGFSADRLDPAVDLARRGALDALILECVGERTMAFGHRDRRLDPARGYNAQLEPRMRALLPPCRDAGTVLITNMGVANPAAAAERTVAIARELGLAGLKIACIDRRRRLRRARAADAAAGRAGNAGGHRPAGRRHQRLSRYRCDRARAGGRRPTW